MNKLDDPRADGGGQGQNHPGIGDDDAARRAFLDAVRRSGIRIDRQGQFWHEGQTVQHAGLRRALFRWLDRLAPPDNRYVLRLDANRFAYLEVEDTPLVAPSARSCEDGFLLSLTDGSEAPLDPKTLTVDDAGTLRCVVRNQLETRLGPAAAAAIADCLDATEQGFLWRQGATSFLLPRRSESRP